MKLTRREIILLFVLAAVVITFVGVRFLIMPAFETNKDKLNTVVELQTQLAAMQIGSEQAGNYEEQIKAEKEKYSALSQPFLYSIDQEQVYYWLSGMLKQNNLTMYSTEFADTSTIAVDYNTNREQPPDEQVQAAAQAAAVAAQQSQTGTNQPEQQTQAAQSDSVTQAALCTQITLAFTGSYSDTERFLDGLYAGGRTLIVNNVSVGDYDKGGKMVILTIQFLGVPLLDEKGIKNLDLPQPEGQEELMTENEATEAEPAATDEQAKQGE